MAPERIIGKVDLKNEKITTKCDIWSLGVSLYFFLFGQLPYLGTSASKLIKTIQKNKLDLNMKGVSPSVMQLLDLID